VIEGICHVHSKLRVQGFSDLKILRKGKIHVRDRPSTQDAVPVFPKGPTLSGRAHTKLLSGQPGTLNAAGLNQPLIDRSAGSVVTPGTTSGRPPIVFVFDGLNPVKDGVKN
jgi:hypothetical protein